MESQSTLTNKGLGNQTKSILGNWRSGNYSGTMIIHMLLHFQQEGRNKAKHLLTVGIFTMVATYAIPSHQKVPVGLDMRVGNE